VANPDPHYEALSTFCQRPRNFTGAIHEKVSQLTERAVLQGDDTCRVGIFARFNRQQLERQTIQPRAAFSDQASENTWAKIGRAMRLAMMA
jgi:hypothetical protein